MQTSSQLADHPEQPLGIGAVSLAPQTTPGQNVEQICDLTRKAVQEGVGLIVFPECAVQGYPLNLGTPDLDQYEHHMRNAESIPGPATEAIRKALGESGCVAVVGLTEAPDLAAGESGKLFNSVAVIGRAGVITKYRKVHTGGVEKCLWNRGAEWVVAESAAGRLGLLICYDLVFPEASRSLALAGAEILVMPTAWANAEDPTFARGYDLFTRARALENQLFLISSNLVGGPGSGFYGHSRIVAPNGIVLAESKGAGVAVATINLRADLLSMRSRSWFGQVFLRDRAPETYRL